MISTIWVIVRRKVKNAKGNKSMWCDCGDIRSFHKVVAYTDTKKEAETLRNYYERYGSSSGYHYMYTEVPKNGEVVMGQE